MEINKKELKIEILNKNHELSTFSSTDPELNEFLKNDALIQLEKKLNVTYVILYKNEIIAYFSILADKIKLKDISNIDKSIKNDYTSFPAIKLGRFAVSKKYQNQGIGTYTFGEIVWNIKEFSKKLGVRFITVNAYASALGFYVDKNNFDIYTKEKYKIKNIHKIIKHEPNRSISLYKDIMKI